MTPKEAQKKLLELDKLFRKYENKHKQKVEAIKSQCEHDWVYCSDPSGNNDSGYYCSGCSSWTTRLK